MDLPSLSRQKTFIVENVTLFDYDTRKAILNVIMMEEGDGVLLVNETTELVSLDLDKIKNPDVIKHIYNIVYNRRETLNSPAYDGQTKYR